MKKRLSSRPLLAVIMVSLTAVIVHGLMIPRLGYYHDDWYMLWSGASRGVDSLVGLFSMDRPFMGVIYRIFYRLLHDSIPGWHLVTLLFRIAGALAFYWILNLVWPRLKHLAILAAMLFVIFPGFLAEPNAATKINHLLGYGAALFSIALALQAAKTGRAWLRYACSGLALVLMALYLWIYEYMIGLEVMRVVLLFWVLWQGRRGQVFATLKRVVLTYLPYVIVIGLFLFWRVFIFESTRSATDLKGLVTDYRTSLVGMALRLLFQVVNDFFSAWLFAWSEEAYNLAANASYGEIGAALVVAAGVVLLAVGLVIALRRAGALVDHRLDEEDEAAASPDAVSLYTSPWGMVLTGGLITLAAVFPVVLSNRHIDLTDVYKAYALHPSAGALIMALGFVAMLKPRFRVTVLILLLGLAGMTQSLNNQDWATYWQLQRSFWWQLTWRAPDIRDNTLVMAYLPDGYVFQQDYEIWGPVNLIYRPGPRNFPPIQSEVLNQGTLLDILQGSVTDPHDRDIYVPRDFKKLLLLSQPTRQSCLHVIDGALPVYSTSERLIIEKAGVYSHVDRIVPTGATQAPPPAIFGEEPEHGWCYAYQQASLARQSGDWRRIGDLYQQVTVEGLKAGDPSEYLVFIEGLTNLGRESEARKLAGAVLADNDALRYAFCTGLSNAPDYPAAFGYRRDQIRALVCSPGR